MLHHCRALLLSRFLFQTRQIAFDLADFFLSKAKEQGINNNR